MSKKKEIRFTRIKEDYIPIIDMEQDCPVSYDNITPVFRRMVIEELAEQCLVGLQKEILKLYLQGYSEENISEILGKSRISIIKHLSSIKKKLREAYNDIPRYY